MNKAFTLVELLIVTVIIAIIAAIAVPKLVDARNNNPIIINMERCKSYIGKTVKIKGTSLTGTVRNVSFNRNSDIVFLVRTISKEGIPFETNYYENEFELQVEEGT